MATIIINTKKEDNAKFILDFVKKLGESGEIISGEEQEDLILGLDMKTEETWELVDREVVFSKLKKN